MSEPRVKICGLTTPEDARAAARAGADHLGAVLVPSSPRAVTADEAGGLAGDLDVSLVLVSADRDPEALARDAETAGADVLQLHGEEEPEALLGLRELGDWTLWKAVRIRDAGEAEAALERYAEVADALLWDGWHPERLGGSGVRFPWAEVARVRREFPPGLELVAAGGLTPENVAAAIDLLEPDVVDVSSGVERAPGAKDSGRIAAFVDAVRRRAATDDRRPQTQDTP